MAFPPAKSAAKPSKKSTAEVEPDPNDPNESAENEGESTPKKKPRSLADLKQLGADMAAKKLKSKQGA